MRKRAPFKHILPLALCLGLILTLLPSAALAVETFTTSDEGAALIMEYEDFRAMPYSDNGKWYIGYGTLCEPEDFPGGVSEWEAEALLREKLVEFEDVVNTLLMDHGIAVSQAQFDAMMSMTYNLGTQWINEDYRFCSYLIEGVWQYSEQEVVNAIATWCHQGSTVREHLVDRRLREAFLFLYGDYDNDGAERYTYINFSPAGGKLENTTVFYPVGLPYGDLPVPEMAGRSFLGWYTNTGVPVTGAETALEPVYLTARWDGEGTGSAGNDVDLSQWVNPYKDVKDSDWFYAYVRELSAKNILGGYPDGTFQAAGTLKTGEALKLILTAARYPDPGNAPSGHWAGLYLELAENLGCVLPGEITDLESPISRLDIARITAAALGLEARAGASPFADVDDGSALALYEEGILNGAVSGGRRYYNPDNAINRAEMCAIVSRVSSWQYTERNDPAQSGYIEFRKETVPVLWDVPAAPYNRNLFVRDGSRMYYNDPAYTTAWGVDVSRHQGDIDWRKVAEAGVEFAFIRVGGRGASTGEFYDDANFETYITGALEAGIQVGVYFYSTAITAEEALAEAEYVLERVRPYSLTYPIAFDWEIYSKDSRNASIDPEIITDAALAFCQRVEQEGYRSLIYVGLESAYQRMNLSRLTDYDLWFAQYNSRNQPDMYYNYRIWQYTDSGTVPGIGGKVDMDLAFIPYY